MRGRIALAVVLAISAVSLAACAKAPTSQPPAGGMKVSPGISKADDGTVKILGTLEFEDLEGGTWKIVGDKGETLAVIANAKQMTPQLEQLKGMQVWAQGVEAGGMSIRSAGPEYEINSITAVTGTTTK